MEKNIRSFTKLSTVMLGVAAGTTMVQASTDYGPAIWNPLPNYYTTGNGHLFLVIHDMEGFYGSAWNVFNGNGTSVHFAVNSGSGTSGVVNGHTYTDSDGKPAGEVSQFVREAYYGWDARCWNKYHIGTEHEGFASNPAWYTEAEYQASASLQKHLCDTWGIAKDRNHIVGHGEKSNGAWVSWAIANMPAGFDPNCNTHSDPGPYWDWTHFMALIQGTVNNAAVVSSSYPATVTVGQTFSATVVMNNNGTKAWLDVTNHKLGSQNPQDNSRWGLSRVVVAGTVNPGQNASFSFNCTAPTTAGSYAFDWKMLEEGVEWFGATATGGINVVVPSADVVVDDNSGGFSASANWIVGSSSTDKYGADYKYRSTAAVSDQCTWTASLPAAGSYKVYAWWPAGANRAASAGYTVYHSTGSTAVNVNQQISGGQWNLLSTVSLNAGSNQVKLSCWTTTGYVVVGDAVRWQQQ